MTGLRGPFRFDDRRHCYTVGGVVVPGVTAVMAVVGHRDGDWWRPEHRERGKAVHAATLAFDLGDDAAEALVARDEWLPYFEAYRKFRAEVRCRFRLLETPRLNRRRRYACTVDRVGVVNGWPAVLEIKTGHPADFHGPQLAGQDMALPDYPCARRRLAVYLRKDGTWQLKGYESAGDYLAFLDALSKWWEVRRDGDDQEAE